MAMKVFAVTDGLGAADVNEYLVNTKYAVKPADTTRTGTTLSDDPDLHVTVDTNKTYELLLMVPFAGANGGLKFNFTGSGGNNLYGYWQLQFSTTLAGQTRGSGYDAVTYNLGQNWSVTDLTGLSIPDILIVQGWLVTSSTAGTFTFRWCQNSGSGQLIARAGAAMRLRRVS
jgi:hypothetical protein